MAGITIVQTATGTAASGNTCTATFGSTPAAGNTLIAFVTFSTGGVSNAAGDYTFSDTAGNTWNQPSATGAYLADNPGGGRTGGGENFVAWVGDCKTHASNVVTLTQSGGTTSTGILMIICEVSGLLAVNNPARTVTTAFQSIGATTTPTASASCSVGDGIFGWITGDIGQTTVPSGWTLISNGGGGGSVAQWKVSTANPTSVTGAATDDGWDVIAIAFEPGGMPFWGSYPERFPFATRTNVEPGAFNPPRVAAAVVAPTVAYWSYPDRIQQPHRTALETAFFNPPPVVAARLSDAAPARRYTAYPDRIDLPPSNLRSEFVAPPPPVVAAHLSDAAPIGAKTSYPDRVDRALAVAQQQSNLDLPPLPIPNATVPPLAASSYPASVPAAARPPSDWSQGGFTDSVDTAGADWSFPDAVLPPRRTPDYVTTVLAPERTQTYIDQDFPDRVPRAPAVAQQQDAATRPLAPERTASLATQWYPDRIALARSAPDAVSFSPKPLPNVAAPVSAYVSYPERIDRVGGLRTANQQDAAARNLVPIVYVRNWDLTSYPVAVPGPQRVAQQQDQASRPMAPEAKLPAPYVSFPERVLGAPFPTTAQQHVAAMPVRLEVTAPNDWYTSFPDIVRGAPFPTSQQQDQAARPLAPEAPLPSDWRTSYSDSVLRPGLQTSAQQASTYPLLPPVAPIAPTYFAESYPDVSVRSWLQLVIVSAWMPDIQPSVVVPLVVATLSTRVVGGTLDPTGAAGGTLSSEAVGGTLDPTTP